MNDLLIEMTLRVHITGNVAEQFMCSNDVITFQFKKKSFASDTLNYPDTINYLEIKVALRVTGTCHP